jgi:beta propeller repeat protein
MKPRRNCWNLLVYAILILTCCLIVPVIAAGTETLISSNASADQAKPSINGNYIVWVDSRYGISQDIYLYNTATLQEYRITDGSAIVDSPDIQGNRVVWIQRGTDI